MKSTIASLRELTLPFGSTTGGRIELDGINGEIRIYDTSGNLQIKLSPDDGMVIYDDLGTARGYFGTIYSGIYSLLELVSGGSDESTGAIVSLYDTNIRNRLVISPGTRNSKGALEWTLVSADGSDLTSALLQVVSTLPLTSLRSYIDLTGASAVGEGQRPYTVVYDLFYGTPNAYLELPTVQGAYGKGVIAYYKSTAADVMRAAGVNTNAFVTATFDAGRLYEVTLKSSLTIDTGGVVYAIELSEGGTIGVNNGTIVERFRRIQAAEVPVGQLAPFSSATVYYVPSSSGVKTLRVRPGTGNTGQILLGHGAGNFTWLVVKEIGFS